MIVGPREPLSLYIIVPPLRLTAYRPLLRMWLSGLMLYNSSSDPVETQQTLGTGVSGEVRRMRKLPKSSESGRDWLS
jgi:hypothetical protein